MVSFTKSPISISNPNAVNGIAAPARAGYDFAGWTTVQGGTVAEYDMTTMQSVADGTVLYAVWTERVEEA